RAQKCLPWGEGRIARPSAASTAWYASASDETSARSKKLFGGRWISIVATRAASIPIVTSPNRSRIGGDYIRHGRRTAISNIADASMTTVAAVRRAVRAFIDANFDRTMSARAWLERLADSGWAKPTWPVEWYGRGLGADLAAVAYEEFARVDAPGPPAGLGTMLAAPTIIAHG